MFNHAVTLDLFCNQIVIGDVYFCFAQINLYVNEYTPHLTSVKIDHPKILKICLSWKRDSIFKLAYLQRGSAICCAPWFPWRCVIAKYKTTSWFEAKNNEAIMQCS